MEKLYNPKKIEEPIYKFWEKSNYFEPNQINHTQKNYCITMPPPNITGGLHLGHAFQQTIIDILIRYNRMQGKNTLWVTGLDHAGIATQILVENDIYNKTKKIKNSYSKNFLLQEIWKWKAQSEKLIIYQMKRLGNSVSWQNNRFTMDPEMSYAVKKAFIHLYQDNLIYRRKRLVNWDCKLQTAISDLEVSHKKIQGSMWYIRYQLEHSINNNNYLIVATTRPETMLGDVALAINPKDTRYHQFIGKYALIPIINRRIPIISDTDVDLNKGTGCVKITPGHDFNDYAIATRHKLPIINILSINKKILQTPEVFNNQGQPTNQIHYYHIPKIFHNLDYNKARALIISECSKLNLLENIKTHTLIVPYNNRTEIIIEPMLTNQWYIRTKNLAEQAKHIVNNDIIQFIPKQYKNIYFEWMNNIQDWCISRQIQWGHEIPAWYDNNNHIYVGFCEKDIRTQYQINNNVLLQKDNDVLDTWFSSSLWTFSSLGWPRNTNLLKIFHPTNVIISGFDIIFFWIARMIMMTLYLIKDKNIQIPFKKVYITGLIRDQYGQKMSKSKGNVIDPLDIIDGISKKNLLKKRLNEINQSQSTSEKVIKYTEKQFPDGIKTHGADALRLTLASLSSSGRDIHWDLNRLSGYHSFCNKLWNVSRFVLTYTNHEYYKHTEPIAEPSLADRWIITKLNQTIHDFIKSLNNYRFDKIVNILYEFVWHQFCDWYIEFTKPILYNNITTNTLQSYRTQYTMITSLETILRLAHPIIPFITEKIWQEVKQIIGINGKTIMLQSFPKHDETIIDQHAITDMQWLQDIISEIRIIRIHTGITSSTPLTIAFLQAPKNIKQCISDNYHSLIKIARLKNINFLEQNQTYVQSIKVSINELKLLVYIPDQFNKNKAIDLFNKSIKLITHKIQLIQQNLNNNQNNIPKTLLIKEQEKLNHFNKIRNKLINQFSIIKNYKNN